MHIYTDIEVAGIKGRKTLKRVIIETGATFTVLPREVIEEIGAPRVPVDPVEVELSDGRRVKAELYAVGVKIGSRWGGTIAVCFSGRYTGDRREDTRRPRPEAKPRDGAARRGETSRCSVLLCRFLNGG